MENNRIRKTYDRDFKVSAMRLILEKHQSVARVFRDLGVSQNAFHQWKRSFLKDSRACFSGNGKATEHEAEVRRLKQERDILKFIRRHLSVDGKALAIFSKTPR